MTEYADEYQTSILTKDGLYALKQYKDEKELEKLVVSNAVKIFGTNSIYFDIKQRVKSIAKTRITDGLLLDLDNKMFWLVEHELSEHDLDTHITPQILGFIRALGDEKTLAEVSEIVYNILQNNEKQFRLAKKLLRQNEIYLALRRMLRNKSGVLIVIDKVTDAIKELLPPFVNKEIRIIEFKTYEKNGKMLYAFTPLHQSEATTLDTTQYSIEEHLARAKPETKMLLNTLRRKILRLHRVNERVSKYWLSYGLRHGTVFAYINTKDITRSFRVLLKPIKQLKNVRGVLKTSGSTVAPYYFRVQDKGDLSRGFDVIKQCYNQHKHRHAK